MKIQLTMNKPSLNSFLYLSDLPFPDLSCHVRRTLGCARFVLKKLLCVFSLVNHPSITIAKKLLFPPYQNIRVSGDSNEPFKEYNDYK